MTLPQDALDEIVGKIVKVLDPEKIFLVGSYARGEAGPDSNVDILVVAEVPDTDNFRTVATREAIGNTPFPMDLLIVTPDEWEMWHTFVNTAIGQAFKYGKELYERVRSTAVAG